MLCVQDPDGRAPYRAACNGDSGSPLLVSVGGHSKIAGIDSWGVSCGTRRNDPTVYMTIPSVLAFATAATPAWQPEPAAPPTITGTETVGSTLTCTAPAWIGTPPASIRFYWVTPRGGAAGPSYVLKARDAGGQVYCRVAAPIDGGGTEYFNSAPLQVTR